MNPKFYTTCFLAIFAVLTNSMIAQNHKYTFSFSVDSYMPLGEVNFVESNLDWSHPYFVFNLPIDFEANILGIKFQGLWNDFTPNLLHTDNVINNIGSPFVFIFPNSIKFQNRSILNENEHSNIKYLTEGLAFDRIFKMEFENVGFINEQIALNTLDMFTNQQIWIYESTGCIEFRFGPTSITSEETIFGEGLGPAMSLWLTNSMNLAVDKVIYAIQLTGESSNPNSVETENDTIPNLHLIGYPEVGTVYTFCPVVPLPVFEPAELNWTAFPNPTTDNLHIVWKEPQEAIYTIHGYDGRMVKSGFIQHGFQSIDLQHLTNGYYILRVMSEKGFEVNRICKI